MATKTKSSSDHGPFQATTAANHRSSKKKRVIHPYKTGGKPSFFIINLTPPPVLVGSIKNLDNVSCFKCQLPVGHGDVIPYCLSTYSRTTTDQLWREKTNSQYRPGSPKHAHAQKQQHSREALSQSKTFSSVPIRKGFAVT